jgi:hypothetical protein
MVCSKKNLMPHSAMVLCAAGVLFDILDVEEVLSEFFLGD